MKNDFDKNNQNTENQPHESSQNRAMSTSGQGHLKFKAWKIIYETPVFRKSLHIFSGKNINYLFRDNIIYYL